MNRDTGQRHCRIPSDVRETSKSLGGDGCYWWDRHQNNCMEEEERRKNTKTEGAGVKTVRIATIDNDVINEVTSLLL